VAASRMGYVGQGAPLEMTKSNKSLHNKIPDWNPGFFFMQLSSQLFPPCSFILLYFPPSLFIVFSSLQRDYSYRISIREESFVISLALPES
jgi:hypothetical protein